MELPQTRIGRIAGLPGNCPGRRFNLCVCQVIWTTWRVSIVKAVNGLAAYAASAEEGEVGFRARGFLENY